MRKNGSRSVIDAAIKRSSIKKKVGNRLIQAGTFYIFIIFFSNSLVLHVVIAVLSLGPRFHHLIDMKTLS